MPFLNYVTDLEKCPDEFTTIQQSVTNIVVLLLIESLILFCHVSYVYHYSLICEIFRNSLVIL